MKEGIIALGVIILVAGIVIALSNPIAVPEVGHWEPSDWDPMWWIVDQPAGTIYPYSIVGAIVALIGFVTIIIGARMESRGN